MLQSSSNDQGVTARGFIDSVSLHQWGVFEDTSVNISASPAFIAITGETGSGKSVFISALEYICGRPGSRSLVRRFHHDAPYQGAVKLRFGSSSSSLYQINRRYDLQRRTSQCSIDGERKLVKDLSNYFSNTIKFWSTEAYSKLDTSEFLSYIDGDLIGVEGNNLKEDVRISFDRWKASHHKLQHLRSLKERANGGDEFGLLSHYITEMKQFEKSLSLFLDDLQDDLENYGWRVSVEDEVEEKDTLHFPASQLLEAIDECIPSPVATGHKDVKGGVKLNFHAVWDVLMESEAFYLKLRKVMEKWTEFDMNESLLHGGSGPSMNELNHVGHADDGGKDQLAAIINGLSDYGDVLLQLKKGLLEAGAMTGNIKSSIEDLYEKITLSCEAVNEAQMASDALTKGLPDATKVLNALHEVKAEWEKLSRKHGCHPRELGQKYESWQNDVRSLVDLDNSLPLQEKENEMLRLDYGLVSSELSQLRYRASLQLIERVNKLLPKLEMADKEIGLEFWTLMNASQESLFSEDDVRKAISGLQPEGLISEYGWDVIRLIVKGGCNTEFLNIGDNSISHFGCDDDNDRNIDHRLILRRLPQTSSDSASLISGSSNKVLKSPGQVQRTSLFDSSSITVEDNSLKFEPITKILSSGECARLALALETIAFSGRDLELTNNDDSEMKLLISPDEEPNHFSAITKEGCLVFDEIDAYLGGAAAVSVARLLKQQGKVRQIIAVTHNPVIAAAADLHIVVERIGKTDSIFNTANTTEKPNESHIDSVSLTLDDEMQRSLSSSAEQSKVIQQKLIRVEEILESSVSPRQRNEGDELFPRSLVVLIKRREDREREIARMATGNLKTAAGIDLAKALLDIDFDLLLE